MKMTGPASTPHNVNSLGFALRALNDALQGRNCAKAHVGRPPRAIDVARLRLQTPAEASIRKVINTGAARMVAAPWRITRAVYPHRPATWPLADRPIATVLADCRTGIEHERERATHWTHDFNRPMALFQAEQALGKLLDI